MNRFLIFLCVLAACSGPTGNPSKDATLADSSPHRKVDHLPPNGHPATGAWTGSLDGRIPVTLQVAVHDSVVSGSIRYLRSREGRPIRLLGRLEPEGYRLFEFGPDGTISGVLQGTVAGNAFTGTWYDPDSDRALPFRLQPADSIPAPPPRPQQGAAASGTYAYAFGKTGGSGGIDVTATTDSASFSINCVTGAPAHNLADLEAGPLPLRGGTLVYQSAESPGCRFRIRFFDDFLVIDYIDRSYDCGFGHNATVEGVFIRTGNVSREAAR